MKWLLENLYNKQYKTGVCNCFEKCRCNNFDYDSSFICNRSARIGKQYEQQKIKIVFIGKEDVSRLTELKEPASFIDTKNQHYRGLKLILASLLGCFDVEKITNKETYVEGEETLHEKFALTNHYHCAFKAKSQNGKNHGLKTTSTMWDCCAPIVKHELEVLRPNIIVIQSGWSAKKKLSNQARIDGIAHYFSDEWTITEDTNIFGLYEAIHTSGRICYIIGSYHPSFHRWNNDTYLVPLKQRINIVRNYLQTSKFVAAE